MKQRFFSLIALLLAFCMFGGCGLSHAQPSETSAFSETMTDSFTELNTETTVETETDLNAQTHTPETEPMPVPPDTTNGFVRPTEATAARTTAAESTAMPSETAAQPVISQETTSRLSLAERLRILGENVGISDQKPDPDFFNDAVFIGDSVTMGLKSYATSERNKGRSCLGSAVFLCCGSMGYTNSLADVDEASMHPTWKGKKVRIEEGIRLCGAKKAFIMLGMNDFNAYTEKSVQGNVRTVLDLIETKNPSVSIYLESVTPIIDGKEHGGFNNEHIRKFNTFLQQLCDERGYTYVDVAQALSDETGHLKKAYCGDAGAMGIHMGREGEAAWAQYLENTFCGG